MTQATMRAVHLTRLGGPEVLEPAEVPRPEPRDGEALIRMSVIPIPYNDTLVRSGVYRHPGESDPDFPFVAGGEGIGVVEQVAGEANGIAVGQRVCFMEHFVGSYAEWCAIPTARLIPLPDDVSDADAAALVPGGLCAEVLLHAYREVGPGVRVLMTGATGSIGPLLVGWAAGLGAEVIATTRSADKLARLRELGAAHAIDVSQGNLVEEVDRITGGQGVELALDGVGGDGFPQVMETLGVRGTAVPYGLTGGLYAPFDPLDLVDRSRRIEGLLLFDFLRSTEELRARTTSVLDAHRRGWIEPPIAQEVPFPDAAEAHRLHASPARVGRILMRV